MKPILIFNLVLVVLWSWVLWGVYHAVYDVSRKLSSVTSTLTK